MTPHGNRQSTRIPGNLQGERWYHLFTGDSEDPDTGLLNIGVGHLVGIPNRLRGCPGPEDYYDSLEVPDEIPLMLPGQIDRVYSPAEVDFLRKLGIGEENQEEYSIRVQE